METPSSDVGSGSLEPADEGTLNSLEFSSVDFDEATAPEWCSLPSSMAKNRYENGRRYHYFSNHPLGRHPLPNDDDEQTREETKHRIMVELLAGKLFLAPIGDSPHRILDLGSGFADWPIEMAEKFPSAEVLAVDQQPNSPGWLPANVDFKLDDFEHPVWGYGHNIDFIHLRYMCFSLKQPQELFRKAYEHLKPGGWIEFQDYLSDLKCDDDSKPRDYPLESGVALAKDAFRKSWGYNLDFIDTLPSDLERLGFVNVRNKVIKVPIGAWTRSSRMRYLGILLVDVLRNFLPGVGYEPLMNLGKSYMEISQLVRDVDACLNDKRIHTYLEFRITWAQKPTNPRPA